MKDSANYQARVIFIFLQESFAYEGAIYQNDRWRKVG